MTVDGINYGPIEAVLDREQTSNVWITFGIREGKNREVRNVLRSGDGLIGKVASVVGQERPGRVVFLTETETLQGVLEALSRHERLARIERYDGMSMVLS